MGFVAPFIPAIGGAIGGILGGKKATSSAMTRTPEESVGLKGAQTAGSSLAGQGTQQFATGAQMIGQGAQTLSQPTGYYQKLLGGNRALASQAVAAPRGAITDTYRGAERGLEQSGVRGAARDQAKIELNRQRAGAISSLITGVQPAAAEALTSIGQGQVGAGAGIAGQGSAATGQAGSIFSQLLGEGAANRQYGRQEGEKFGQGFGGLIFDLLSGLGKKSGGQKALPSRSFAGIAPLHP